MGRTLHYEVQGDYSPFPGEDNALIALSRAYNDKYNWTCESVGLFSLDYRPVQDDWDFIEKIYEEYLTQGLTHVEAIQRLSVENLVTMNKNALRGFTKVGSNEFNAHTVIQFILDASKILPKQTLSLYDEGDSLYCPVLIKNGKAKPDIAAIKDTLKYWSDKGYLHDGGMWDVAKAESYFKMLLKKKHRYGDINKYVRSIDNREKPKQFETAIFAHELGVGLKDITDDFLTQEYSASEKYYDDVKTYPVN